MLSRLALLAVLVMAAGAARAEPAVSLYQEEIAVSAKDDKSRGEDFRRALSGVLGRVIAVDALTAPAVAALLGQASDFVEEFEYRAPTNASGEPPGRSQLRVVFDREHLGQKLAAARIGAWGQERPDVVVWLSLQEGAQHRFVAAEESEFSNPLNAAASTRRLPVILPLLDLADQTNLAPGDIEAGDPTRIREATAHYESDVALAGSLRRVGEGAWEGSWRFLGFGENQTWRSGPSELQAVLKSGIDGAYGRLIDIYAPKLKSQSMIELQVEGIASMSDAGHCGDYLRSLPIVTQADWLRAEPNGAVWRLKLSGNPETFRKILGVSRLLRPAAGEPGGRGGFAYRWVP
jgi:uncharacterized protein